MLKIRVQMPHGTGSVSVAGHNYMADEDGVVHLEHAEHVAPLVGMGGIELRDDEQGGVLSVLVGSDTFPATNEVGEESISLGELVRQTHERTGVSVDEWNNLPARVRDILLGYQLGAMRGEIGDTRDLSAQLAEARSRIAELEAVPEEELPQKPSFADMTKAVINEWLVANGGEAIGSGTHAEHVAAAEARWAELSQEG